MDTATEAIKVMPIERLDGTHCLRLCVDQGLLTTDMTRRVLEIMEAHPGVTLRATTGQRMNLEGIPSDKVDEIIAKLGTPIPKCPPHISVCAGGGLCKYAQLETRDFGFRLKKLIMDNGPYPFKVKSGVSGCGMGCAMSFVRDIGLVAKAKGWDVLYGGSAKHRAAPGLRIAKSVTEDEALAAIEKGLVFYKENARQGERIGMLVRRLGHDVVSEALK